eukprot:1072846-Pleurochrysis_carterae.AAC.1
MIQAPPSGQLRSPVILAGRGPQPARERPFFPRASVLLAAAAVDAHALCAATQRRRARVRLAA